MTSTHPYRTKLYCCAVLISIIYPYSYLFFHYVRLLLTRARARANAVLCSPINSPLLPLPWVSDGTDGLPPAFVEKALPAGTSLPTVGATVTLAAVPDTGMPPLLCFFCDNAQGASAVCVVSHPATFVKGSKHKLRVYFLVPPSRITPAFRSGDGNTVLSARGPSGTLAYTVTLNTELDLSDDVATSEFKAAFSNDVSVVLAIDPDQVMITSLKPGSLVVSFALQMMTCGNGFQCSWVGDGWCDAQGAYNTAEHMYDGGDCCPDTCTLGSTAPFYAGLAPERSYVCGVGGYDCKRPGGTDVPQFFDYGFITTNVEPTTTPPTSTTSTTTEEPTTVTTSTTTSTTTAEPTTTVYCSYTNITTTFEQGLNRYFADNAKECAINTFDTSAVTTMQHTFVNKKGFNQNINNWATSAVTNMLGTFSSAAAFNQNLNNWNTGTVTNMLATFSVAAAFNQNINNWNTSAVTTMRYMFQYAAAFNQNINNWATGAVTSMREMFLNAAAFNQNINGIDTGAVTTMKGMFRLAVAFDQTITGWDVTKVTTVTVMFEGATLMSKAQRPISELIKKLP